MSTNNRLRDLPKSRVLTTGFKLFSGLALYGLFASLVSGLNACQPHWVGFEYPPIQCSPDAGQGLIDSVIGPLTFGWKGGVGNQFVFTVFVTMAGVAIFMAGLMTAYRDADPKSVAEAAHTDTPPIVNPPRVLSYWPLVTAFAVAVAVLGLVVNSAMFVVGCVGIGLAGLMWVVRDWAETATGDHDVNEEVRETFIFGLEVPLIAVVTIGAVAMSISRILLNASRLEAVAVAGLIAAGIFILGTLIAYVPKLNKNALGAIVIACVLVVIGMGVVSAASGEREFHEPAHEEPVPGDAEPTEDEGDDGDTVGESDSGSSDGSEQESGESN